MNERQDCEICGRNIAVMAYVSHMRQHVRNGEATEHHAHSFFADSVFLPTKRGETLQRDKKLAERCEAMNPARSRKTE